MRKIAPLAIGLTILLYSCNKNEFAPEIYDQEFSIEENSPAGTEIGQVIAIDNDEDQTLSFEIIEGNPDATFAIEKATGILTVADPAMLNFEENPSFQITVSVTDSHKDPLESAAEILITLEDVNEFTPEADDQVITMDENPAPGQVVANIDVTDGDTNQEHTFSFVGGNESGAFSIDVQNGEITVLDSTQLDYEQTNAFTLQVQIQDNHPEPLSNTIIIQVNLNDVVEFTDGLLAYYTFDGDVTDQGPLQIHGQQYNASYAEDRDGNPSSSIYFNGVDAYMTIPHNEALNFQVTSDRYSITFWIKADTPLGAHPTASRVLEKWNERSPFNYPYSFLCGVNRLAFQIRDNSSYNAYLFGEIWDGQWYHIAVTVDGVEKTVSYYQNGELLGADPITITGNTKNSLDIIAGIFPTTTTYYFNGYLDNLTFHNRILSAEEIDQMN